MKGLRKILRVSWTVKKTNEWVLNKAGVKREQENCLEKEIMQGTMPGVCRRERPVIDRTLCGRVNQNDRG